MFEKCVTTTINNAPHENEMAYYKKFADARKHCRPGYTTLYCNKMGMYYNGRTF